jgi:alkanesulfonate monooxygenase SsuD/methylene tetrahydromethanopterin reductase-like flavin-dependent oxidoreductase (luciferase family)
MHFGGAMFFTDYSMSAPELARALEERGFESVWAPEHSHIPLSRKTPLVEQGFLRGDDVADRDLWKIGAIGLAGPRVDAAGIG